MFRRLMFSETAEGALTGAQAPVPPIPSAAKIGLPTFRDLKIVAPYYADDAYGLMRSCIRDNDPTLFFYHEGSLGVKAEIADPETLIPLSGAARIRREGTDVTILAIQSMVPGCG